MYDTFHPVPMSIEGTLLCFESYKKYIYESEAPLFLSYSITPGKNPCPIVLVAKTPTPRVRAHALLPGTPEVIELPGNRVYTFLHIASESSCLGHLSCIVHIISYVSHIMHGCGRH